MSQTSKSTFVFVQFCQILVLIIYHGTIFPFVLVFSIVLHFSFMYTLHILASCPCSTDFRHVAPNTSGPTHQTSPILVGTTKLEGPDTVRGRRTTFRFHLEHITDRSKVKIGKKVGNKRKKHRKKHLWLFLESEILSKFLGGPWNPRSERIPQDALLKHKCIEKVLCQCVLCQFHLQITILVSLHLDFGISFSYPLSSLTWNILIPIGTLLTSVHCPGWVVSSGFASLSCSSRSCPKHQPRAESVKVPNLGGIPSFIGNCKEASTELASRSLTKTMCKHINNEQAVWMELQLRFNHKNESSATSAYVQKKSSHAWIVWTPFESVLLANKDAPHEELRKPHQPGKNENVGSFWKKNHGFCHWASDTQLKTETSGRKPRNKNVKLKHLVELKLLWPPFYGMGLSQSLSFHSNLSILGVNVLFWLC